MGILGTAAETIFEINLMLQFMLVILLALGFYQRRTFVQHGRIMALATILNLGATALVMLPSLILNFGALVGGPFNAGVGITIGHSIGGSIALALGLLFSVRFLIKTRNSQPLTCGTRRTMYLTLILWLFALSAGLAFFAFYYL
ncbi:MAG: hypothetical protein ACFFFC_06675 [Candidatus Thorarchaeota archaeon]